MITMTLDHIRIAMGLGPSGATWYNSSSLGYRKYDGNQPLIIYYFICSIITFICSPGFFFLMGFGMVYFYQHRHNKLKWSHQYTTVHLMIRGIVIIICGVIMYYLCYKTRNPDGEQWFPSDVLIPLGFDMFLISIFVAIENYTYNECENVYK